jgi:hypothetical protein
MALEILSKVGRVRHKGGWCAIVKVRCTECGRVYQRTGRPSNLRRVKNCMGCVKRPPRDDYYRRFQKVAS